MRKIDMNNRITRLGLLAAMAFVLMPQAGAHHAMDYAAPVTFLQGLLSGLAHPIIGLDHFLFILGFGAACRYLGRGAGTLLGFLGAAVAGTLLHFVAPALPSPDAWVAASLLVLALVVLSARGAPARGPHLVGAFFVAAGLLHGYAYGEAVLGAEAAPVAAYLLGFTIVQLIVIRAGYALAGHVERVWTRQRAAGVTSLLLIHGAGSGATRARIRRVGRAHVDTGTAPRSQ
jgi:urease accessory protein